MTVCIVLVCSFALYFSIKIEKHVFNPLSAFSILWMIITIAASLKLYGINEADFTIYLIVLLGIFFYMVGYIFSAGRCNIVLYKRKYNDNCNMKLRYKFACILAIIALLYFLNMATVAIVYLLQGKSLKFVRMQLFFYQNSELYEGTLSYAIKSYVMQTIVDYLPIVAAVDLVIGKKNKLLAGLNIALLSLFVIVSGGRLCILYFLVDIVTVYLLSGKKIKFSKLQKRLIKIMAIVAVGAIVFVSLNREIEDVMKSYYVYLAGCYPYLQIFKDRVCSEGFYAYGMSTLRGPLQALFAGLKLTRIISVYPDLFMKMADYCNTAPVYYIGDNIRFNGFVSIFYYFFVDFHYFGVVLGSFLYGGISKKIYRRAKKRLDVKSMAILCCLMQSIVVSFARFEFSLVHFFLATVLIFISYKKENVAVNAV